MDKTQLLAILFQMRGNKQYQAAEALRQTTGAAEMAKADKKSPEYAAINFLINTWETISLLALEVENRDLVFQVTPALYMFTELNDAVDIIGADLHGYASHFRLLSKHQLEWLKFKDERYQTSAKSGMHALFG